VRQSKRYSVTALYLSMSAKDKELEIEDDLARGMLHSYGCSNID
jgi:Ras GTPase-activating-like protein IQGAP2/3